jgi:hypothetical protein
MHRIIVTLILFGALCALAPLAYAATETEQVLVAQADEPAEPTPTWMIVDAGARAETVTAGETSSRSTIDPDDDPVGYARQLFDAVQSGQGTIIVAMILIGLVYVARRWGGSLVPWLQTDRGGVALAGGLALVGGLANAILAGATVDLDLALTVLEVALLAMGGWTGVRRLLWPPDRAAPA